MKERLKKGLLYLIAAGILLVGSSIGIYSAVQQLAGLAVAQTATQWNNLKDAAVGDGLSNGVGAFSLYGFNGTTFDRWRCTITEGCLVKVTDISGGVTPSDTFGNPLDAVAAFSLTGLWNAGTSQWTREYGLSSTSNLATTSLGHAYNIPLSTWSVTNTPAVAAQATASKASGGGTVRHVATTITACVAAAGTVQTPLLIHLRDGATGAGTILRSWAVSSIINESHCVDLSGLNMTGSAATAMTIETAAAPVADAQATVTLTGYSTP